MHGDELDRLRLERIDVAQVLGSGVPALCARFGALPAVS